MNALQVLESLGQSIWYDNISRSLIRSGGLKKLVEQGTLGVTSNPTIFEKAIAGSADYDEQMKSVLATQPASGAEELIQAMMVQDIQEACDTLRPVYDRTKGRDGYVSVEVSPRKARMKQPTIDEARDLWQRINRPNLMVKIPATVEGLPAIEQCTHDGININVTLIFSVTRYREVAAAYIRGLERRVKAGRSIESVHSVASVFVSRIDTLVDDMIAKMLAADPSRAAVLTPLLGKAAVANTKMVYQAFKEIFEGPTFTALAGHHANLQRPLWGSTGTKNAAYSDLLYVATLVGPHTVNTVPPATYDAIVDHAKPSLTVESDLAVARASLDALAGAGIDMAWVTKKLEEDGVAAFEKSFDGLYRNVDEKRTSFLS